LVQNALKYLLGFGSVTHYLGYNALQDFFPTMSMKPNPSCYDKFCIKNQEQYKLAPAAKIKPKKVEEKVVHEDNEWGIKVIDESVNVAENLEVASGLKLAYERPQQDLTQQYVPEIDSSDQQSLEELMRQMKQL